MLETLKESPEDSGATHCLNMGVWNSKSLGHKALESPSFLRLDTYFQMRREAPGEGSGRVNKEELGLLVSSGGSS